MASSAENLQKVSDLIKHDLSLERVKFIKDQLKKEKSTLEYQLSKESDKYYELVENSLELLNISQDSVKTIREKLEDVNKLSSENNSSISRYEVIFNATKVYEIIDMTSSIYNKIVRYNELVSAVDQMLDTELEGDSLETGCPYLLQIHFLLTKTRDFQDQMTVMAKASTDDVQRTVQKVFSKANDLVVKFNKLLEALIYDVVEIVRAGQASLVIRLFKIIDIEEREDLKIIAIKNIIKKKEMELHNSAIKKLPSSKNMSRFSDSGSKTIEYPTNNGLYEEIMNGSISTRVIERGYKEFLFEKIRQSIQDMFIEVRKEYQGDKRFDVLANLDWVFNELLVVKKHVKKFCPAYWDIFSKYYDLYLDEIMW
ncbi:hypothetical protein Kpol_259p6 [Vanderwaltozyma polyspora DSM 70294]|uniref:Uncharacterized protein n=1 Tax=Vanderwaltozyma polyspora (strain ATCC 22028 / DSM 70294 / BCRC 21397 / CBS 2163 / NBRC 10782 / NRRL Y-8283 / UCD 57-17) TaxID=436907 RepID=A7TT69_VANPO|nr:uncharacterized protein Kpol_259p6 [Vanderwaltozyma polyspora DSM 70294]EDO14543.1 hypothetical protein Kpol_259p6 [Vanderwaltozyma polyspora DSM 70294]